MCFTFHSKDGGCRVALAVSAVCFSRVCRLLLQVRFPKVAVLACERGSFSGWKRPFRGAKEAISESCWKLLYFRRLRIRPKQQLGRTILWGLSVGGKGCFFNFYSELRSIRGAFFGALEWWNMNIFIECSVGGLSQLAHTAVNVLAFWNVVPPGWLAHRS